MCDAHRDELYHLLEVDRRATAAEIKSAFRNKSLELHPDKLAQRGQRVIDEGKAADFVNFKHAYDVSLATHCAKFVILTLTLRPPIPFQHSLLLSLPSLPPLYSNTVIFLPLI